MSNTKKLRRAILYARISTSEIFVRELSFSKQIEQQTIYCQRYNIEVVDVFYDLAQGDTFDREEYHKIIQRFSLDNSFADIIVCSTWERFSTTHLQAQLAVLKLNEMGIEVKIVKHYPTDYIIEQRVKKSKKGKYKKGKA